MMRPLLFIVFFLSLAGRMPAQSLSIGDSISRAFIYNTISFLANDKLKGRANYSNEQLLAAEFISNEFKAYGLKHYMGGDDFYIPFRTTRGKRHYPETVKWNGRSMEKNMFQYYPARLNVGEKKLNEFTVLKLVPPLADSILFDNWFHHSRNLLIWVVLNSGDSLNGIMGNVEIPKVGPPISDILIVGAPDSPGDISISGHKDYQSSTLFNMVGVLPGRSLENEVIIFSAHYDHVNMGLMGERGEIYNGANDNASGTTAVLALAKYFAMRNDNERTLIFCLFSGEEQGLMGSTAFTYMIDPETVIAMINIEMIGNTNAVGKNAFLLTGPEHSNLTGILSKNLKGEKVKTVGLYNDPSSLFSRSDNYPFARKGVPAHTIMCSNDSEKCYHRPCDDVKRIDVDNMTKIIQAIARSCQSLINGKDTPSRIRLFN